MSGLAGAFAGRRVLLTGHTGFKGSWLALWLHRLGADVTGLALPREPGRPYLFDAMGLRGAIAETAADIRDPDAVGRAVERVQPEVIFHLAAQALVRDSYERPVETYATNVMGTVHVLDAARRTDSVRVIINVTSDKCYENREWLWGYREGDRLGGRDPYSSSKACAELVTAAYAASYLQSPAAPVLASVRAGNVIGGGDWATDRIIPDLVRAFLSSVPARIRRPGAIRPWQHVLEPLGGYLELVAAALREGHRFDGAWNFGPLEGATLTVGELAERAARLWGAGALDRSAGVEGVHESHYLRLDSSKALTHLGYRPLLTVEQALEMTMDWYRSVELDGASARDVSLEQLETYRARRSDSTDTGIVMEAPATGTHQ